MSVLRYLSDDELDRFLLRAVRARASTMEEPQRSACGQWCLDALAESRRRARGSDVASLGVTSERN